MPNIVLKNLTEKQEEDVRNLVKSWGVHPQNIKEKNINSIIFLSKEEEKIINNFRLSFRKYILSKDENVYRDSLRPLFEQLFTISMRDIRYNKKLITDQDLEDIRANTEIDCFKGIDSYDYLSSLRPEYYFLRIIQHRIFQDIKKLEKKGETQVCDEAYQKYIEEFYDEFIAPDDNKEFFNEIKILLEKRLETLRNKKGWHGNVILDSQYKIIESLLRIEEYDGKMSKNYFYSWLKDQTGLPPKQFQRAMSKLKQSKENWWRNE